MNEEMRKVLDKRGPQGLPEVRWLLRQVLGGREAAGRLIDQTRLRPQHPHVYRLRFALKSQIRSLVVKCLRPGAAQRAQLALGRWLPVMGLSHGGPALLGVAAERHGQCVWHVYEDLGDWALDAAAPHRERVEAAVRLIAQIHTRFASHPLLAECRLQGDDFGIQFFGANLRDAIRCLKALRPPHVHLSEGEAALRDRLLERMRQLHEEQPWRTEALAQFGGAETLLHGDLWTSNAFVLPVAGGWRACLIDWDRAGVGPFSYDLSTFLLRFPPAERPWILEVYRDAVRPAGWRLPAVADLNLLFETAECARFANGVIWPALALVQDQAKWGFEMLAEVERWFEDLRPVVPEAVTSASGLVSA